MFILATLGFFCGSLAASNFLYFSWFYDFSGPVFVQFLEAIAYSYRDLMGLHVLSRYIRADFAYVYDATCVHGTLMQLTIVSDECTFSGLL